MTTIREPRRGRLLVGTSGFAYPAWAPRFYPAGVGTRGERLLRHYAAQLPACELNNTFYQQPRPDRVTAWLAATPASFRFAVKAQRGGSLRALSADAAAVIGWLTAPYRLFGERLGSVLFRVPEPVQRDDAALDRLLANWPADLPLTVEFQHPSWHDDTVYDRLRIAGAVLCTTELDTDEDPPRISKTGDFLYCRLRRSQYSGEELAEWAARLLPFLDDGVDVHAYLRHDETGEAPHRALELARRVSETERSNCSQDATSRPSRSSGAPNDR